MPRVTPKTAESSPPCSLVPRTLALVRPSSPICLSGFAPNGFLRVVFVLVFVFSARYTLPTSLYAESISALSLCFLNAARITSGYKSRKDFAVALNGKGFEDINSIYRWEAGLRAPSFPTLKKIAALLGTSVSYLIGEIDYAGRLTPSAIEANRKKEDIISDVATNAAAISIPIV